MAGARVSLQSLARTLSTHAFVILCWSAVLQIDELKERLRTLKRLSPKDLLLIDAVLAYGGVASRGGDLFGKNSMLSKLSTTVKVREM